MTQDHIIMAVTHWAYAEVYTALPRMRKHLETCAERDELAENSREMYINYYISEKKKC